MPTMIEALEIGLGHHRAGRLAEAREVYRSVLAAAPAQPHALYLHGVLLAQNGEDHAAEHYLMQAVVARPDDPDSRLALANLLYRTGRADRAIALWRAVLSLDPAHGGAALNLAAALRVAGDWRGAAAICQAALVFQPGSAPHWTSLAAALLAGGALALAQTAAEAALDLDRGLAEAWFVRGSALSQAGQWHQAAAALRQAIALQPDHAQAALNLGNALISLGSLDDAEAQLRNAVRLDPLLPQAHTSLGFLHAQRHRLAASVACHDQALALLPDFAEAHSNRAAALLLAGDYARGFAAYEWRKQSPRHALGCWRSDRPQWRGEHPGGRTLLIFCEQGFGDTIMCARFIPVVAALGARIVLIAAPALLGLLAVLPGVAAVVPRGRPGEEGLIAHGATVPPYDFWIDQLSLPLVLGLQPAAIPGAHGYLAADPQTVAAWQAQLPAGYKVGLAWAGNPAHSDDRNRSMPLRTLLPVLHSRAARWVSLQCGAAAAQAAHMGLIDLTDRFTDFGQTAACLACLDLVITVDSAVAHLAGALGIPCWLLLPFGPDWRWMLDRRDSPWYASMLLFRQSAPGEWGPVVQAVCARLAASGSDQERPHVHAA